MTLAEPRKLTTVQAAVIGAALSLLGMLSGWLMTGKGWLETSGGTTRQVSVNSDRLAVVESKLSISVSRAEHDELKGRVIALETVMPTREELIARLDTQKALIENQSRQIADLREQVVQVRILLNERTVPSTVPQAQENLRRNK